MNLIIRLKFPIIFLIAILTRVFALYFYRDIEVANEWGIILSNLEQYNILSVHSVQGVPVPNIFMPPLYPLFLYAVKIFFTNTEIFLWVIQFIQILFALISIYFTHKILLEFFSEKLSLIGTLIFTIFPLNIYAVSQISSISMQILLINVFLFSLLRLFRKLDYKYIFMFSISSIKCPETEC